ncbi:MAG: histidine kinase [Pseudomonadales bacterium]|nr:histidine kinase [Pseudomonadales bacterium]
MLDELYATGDDLTMQALQWHCERMIFGKDEWGTTLYVWTPWLPLTPLVMLLAARFPVLLDNLLPTLLKHFCMMLLLAVLHGYISAMLYYHIAYIAPDMVAYAAWQHTGHFLFQDDMFLIDAFIYTVLVASQNISSFFRLVRQKELDALRMESQLSESKLQALKMQINPHFLFNTLNSIAVLVKKRENDKAGNMIDLLSDFFRQTLAQGEEQTVPLRRELALVENAIKHGLARKTGPCHLLIKVDETPVGMALQVVDDGVGTATPSLAIGLGLRNVQDRLLALYAGRHQFAFTSSPAAGTTISIVLGKD